MSTAPAAAQSIPETDLLYELGTGMLTAVGTGDATLQIRCRQPEAATPAEMSCSVQQTMVTPQLRAVDAAAITAAAEAQYNTRSSDIIDGVCAGSAGLRRAIETGDTSGLAGSAGLVGQLPYFSEERRAAVLEGLAAGEAFCAVPTFATYAAMRLDDARRRARVCEVRSGTFELVFTALPEEGAWAASVAADCGATTTLRLDLVDPGQGGFSYWGATVVTTVSGPVPEGSYLCRFATDRRTSYDMPGIAHFRACDYLVMSDLRRPGHPDEPTRDELYDGFAAAVRK